MPKQHQHALSVCGAVLATFATVSAAHAAAPAPSGSHPRIWLNSNTLSGLKAQSQVPGSAVARGAERCLKARQNPASYSVGGWQGFEFVLTLSGCMISYQATGNADDLATAIKYWNVLLDDYQKVGDGAGGDSVVTHDTGYAMRTFAPYSALAYDWLHDAPGVTEALRAKSRARFDAWMKYYSTSGYLKDMPGANYQAGYLFAATLIAIAEGGEAGAQGEAHWATVRDVIWGKDMAAALAPGGVLEGGDWPEGWQYGPLSVLEYSFAARALADNGLPVAGMDNWANSVALRFQHGLTPVTHKAFAAGDNSSKTANLDVMNGPLLAVLAGPASESHKAYARKLKADLAITNENPLFDAVADATTGASEPYPQTSSLNYLAGGIGNWYLRGAWSNDTIWSVFQCSSRLVDDHQHNDAGNWVLTRGADDVVVDPSPYGSLSTLTGNAPAIDSKVLPPGYSPSQAGWGTNTRLDFAKQTTAGVAAGRCDYADQFRFESTPSDVSSALRDFVMIPNGANGTVVIVDRAVTNDPTRAMHLRVRSPGTLALSGDVATATVGGSSLAINKLYASSGTPNTRAMPTGSECWETTKGGCETSRLPYGTEYRIDVSGPSAFAMHVVDTGAAGTPAPANKLLSGTGYRGALIERDQKRVAVITNDAADATPGASLSYRVPAGANTVHVVLDAPNGAEGRSDVTATLDGTDCAITVAPHTGATGGYEARPLMLSVSATCGLGEEPTQEPEQGGSGGQSSGAAGSGGAPGGSPTGTGGSASSSPKSEDSNRNGSSASGILDNSAVIGGCSCQQARADIGRFQPVAAVLVGLLFAFRRRLSATKRQPR